MTDFPEGTPCWADAMFPDVEGAKSFYADVLGWTFGESASEFGNYTQAYSDGKAVAAVVPPMPGDDTAHAAWCLYLATPDAAATAQKAKDAGGTLLMEPMQVGDFGTMALVKDPDGAVFGVWQAGRHHGFEKKGEVGAYVWSEFFTREPDATDAFLRTVFPYGVQKVDDEHVDFALFSVGGKDDQVMGRMAMPEEVPRDVPAHVNVYFGVDDCDAAVKRAAERGATLRFGPMSTPFGRFATLTDPQGAAFSVLDPETTEGDKPGLRDA